MLSSGLIFGGVFAFILLVAALIVAGLVTGKRRPCSGDSGSTCSDSGFSSFEEGDVFRYRRDTADRR